MIQINFPEFFNLDQKRAEELISSFKQTEMTMLMVGAPINTILLRIYALCNTEEERLLASVYIGHRIATINSTAICMN